MKLTSYQPRLDLRPALLATAFALVPAVALTPVNRTWRAEFQLPIRDFRRRPHDLQQQQTFK